MSKHDRVADRPDPASWGEDELMTLSEAARLLWPHGPITERTLRTAVRDGRLAISQVARKFLVTRRSLAMLSECAPVRAKQAGGGRTRYEEELAAFEKMGR